MRRSLASLLLVLLVGTLALPFLQAQPDVPACCRRGGQHHCAMPLPGDGFRAIAPCCPYRHFTALTSHSVTALRVPVQALVLSLRWHNAIRFDSPDVARYVEGNAQKRGPPLA
ncbi:MAG: hypothetical protein ABSD98_13075 [Candidatus Korobacteraceae bacterium]|jgi:hypothetical protein